VHQVDHGGGRAPLRHGVDGRGHRSQAVAETSIGRWNGQPEQSALAERRDRLSGKRRLGIDLCRPRFDRGVGDGGCLSDDLLLLFVQAIHVSPSVT